MRELHGSGCRGLLAPVLMVAFVLAGCSRQPETQGPTDALLEFLPDVALFEGWEVAEGPVDYDPESLWEYLNGGAPLYESYGFLRLVHARYQPLGDPSSSVTIDIFEMESELGAFGLYTSIRPPGADAEAWGAEGFLSGGVAGAYKGTIFVHAGADHEGAGLVEVMRRLMKEVGRRASGAEGPPAIVRALPDEGLVERSERYLAEDLFGHSFLPGGMIASYRIDGREGQLYFSQLEGHDAAAAGLAGLRSHLAKWGEIVGEAEEVGDGGFDYTDPGLGLGTAAAAGRFVVGAQGEFTSEERHRLLALLIDGLNGVS